MSCCTSEADDSMDTDSSVSQGQVMSINGVHPFEQPENLARRTENPLNPATSQGHGERRVSQEDKSLKRKRKWSGQIESRVINARNASPVTESPDQGQPLAPGEASDAVGKRQKTDILSPQQARAGSNIASYLNWNEMLFGLTPPIWQRIFSYVPPVFLGRLLRVTRKFYFLLSRASDEDFKPEFMPYTGQYLMPGHYIWTASRQRFAPGLPKPLIGQDELDMWRLLRGNDCQRCGHRKILMTIGNDSNAWHSGPGGNGVRVIWPFGIRSCGSCLIDQCEKEVSLLCSNTFPSFLLQALPCVFLTQFNDCVSPSNLRNGIPPPEIQITKYFFKSHLDKIETRFMEVKELGSGPVEEWIKGLDAEKKTSMQDAARWEQWEAKGGLKKVNQRPSARSGPSQKHPIATAALPISSQPTTPSLQHAGTRSFDYATTAYDMTGSQGQFSSNPSFPLNNAHGNLGLSTASQDVQSNVSGGRPGRSIHDVNEAKAARRADIEKRCMALDPPIRPGVLIHMESFQAALQISTPLTERAWEILRPRLLVQREEAEAREAAITEHARAIQQTIGDHESHLKDNSDASDREWELAQAPMRESLAAHADAIIAEKWAAGAVVTKSNAPVFAADVLLSCRATLCNGISSEGPRSDRSRMEQAHLSNRRPTLETMKWLYDQKIKPLTERFQRELFLCNGCEANSKFYGFEAVIQHYAAKHTSALSLGNVVVNWRAEWPDEPPFHPSPRLTNGTSHSAQVHAKDEVRTPSHQTFHLPANTAYVENNPPLNPTVSAVNSAFGLVGYSSTSLAHSASSQAFSEPFVSNGEYHASHFDQEYQGYASQSAPDARQVPDNQIYPTGASLPSGTGMGFVPAGANGHSTAAHDNLNTFVRNGYPAPLGATDLYHTQLNEMAGHARDVWFGTSGIKDMPQSVRIYVVIQHVVCRFEHKYTNEPSISMFIDGLNHNAAMRPVRSLNGLACKTCADTTAARAVDVTQAQVSTGERKLFTLPLLLNHFRSVHVEKSRPTVDLQTGMESSQLDWKRDMIDLPDAALITNLMNAPGIDDKKLHLIAWVFPGLFPNPLPKLDSRTNSSMFRKSEQPPQTYTYRGKGPDSDSSSFKAFAPTTTRLMEDQQPPTSRDDRPSPSSRGTEPPGDDEYDPHRPAYLGRIIESHPLHHSSLQRSPPGYFTHSTVQRGSDPMHQQTIRKEPARYHGQGAYGDLLLRHQAKSGKRAFFQDEIIEHDPALYAERFQSTNETPDETFLPQQLDNPRVRRADVVAADRFLQDLGTAPEMPGRRQNLDHTVNPPVSEADMHHLYTDRPVHVPDKRPIRTASSLEREPTSAHPLRDTPTQRRIADAYTTIGADATNEGSGLFSNNPVQYVYSTVRNTSHQGLPEAQRGLRSEQSNYQANSGAQTMRPFELRTEDRHRLDTRAYRPMSPGVRTIRYDTDYYEGSDLEPRDRQLGSYPTDPFERLNKREEYDPGKVEYIFTSKGQSRLNYPGTVHERRVEYIPVIERSNGEAPSHPVFVAARAYDGQSTWNRSEANGQGYGQFDQSVYYRANQNHSPIPKSTIYGNRRDYEYIGD